MTIRPLCTFPTSTRSSSQVAKARTLLKQSVPGCNVRLLSVADMHAMTHSLTAHFDDRDALAVAWVKQAEEVAGHVAELVKRLGQRELVR